jgi:hypothetical protein
MFGSKRINQHRIARKHTSDMNVSGGTSRAMVRASAANCSHDSASQPTIARWLSQEQVEIIKRCDQTTRFVALPKSWVVQITLARLNRGRRLGMDWENPNRGRAPSC